MARSSSLINLIRFIAFTTIFLILFNALTWLMRGNNLAARRNVFGFTKQKNDIDVVFLGASDVLSFNEPLRAMHDYGYTSYNYGTSSGMTEMLNFYAEDTAQTNDALLNVFSLRMLYYADDEDTEAVFRNWSDSQPILSPVRLKGIASYLSERDVDDVLSYYLDIIKYHTNYGAFLNEDNLAFLNRSTFSLPARGFSPYLTHTPFERPVLTDEIGELSAKQKSVLNNLLDYCDQNSINALFVYPPFALNEDECKFINAAGEIIQSRGYTLLDLNRFYDEMGLNFETDMGDRGHINYLGVKKYVTFLSQYLKDNYALPDRRGDADYETWAYDYEEMLPEMEDWEKTVKETVSEHLAAKELGDELRRTDDLTEWLKMIRNKNFTVIIKNESTTVGDANLAMAGLADMKEPSLSPFPLISVYSGDEKILSASDGTPVKINIGVDAGRGYDECEIFKGTIKIRDINYGVSGPGIQALVYDNNYKKVIDNVAIDTGTLRHLPI